MEIFLNKRQKWKYSLSFSNLYRLYLSIKVLDCIKWFNKNLYSVDCATLCYKSDVTLYMYVKCLTFEGSKWPPAVEQSLPVCLFSWTWKPCSPGGRFLSVPETFKGEFTSSWEKITSPFIPLALVFDNIVTLASEKYKTKFKSTFKRPLSFKICSLSLSRNSNLTKVWSQWRLLKTNNNMSHSIYYEAKFYSSWLCT